MKILIKSFVVFLLLRSRCFFKIDMKDIQYHYALLCGPSDHNHNPLKLPITSNEVGLCPVCSNDAFCWSTNSCCPETDLNYPARVCLKNIVYLPNRTDISKNIKSYKIVQSCPPGSNNDLRSKCLKETDDISDNINNSPVSDIKTYVTFKNRYCAECNSVYQYVSWRIDVNCNQFYDPFSSTDEIVVTAKKNNCEITFHPPVTIADRIKPCLNQRLISKCNTTGTWLKYNKNIETGCQTIDNVFPPFKNVFCYICNPPKQPSYTSHELVKTCADHFYTTKFSRSDVKYACQKVGISEATYPYKNIYCYMCNLNNSIHDLFRPYSVSISDKFIYNLIDTTVYDSDARFDGNIIQSFNSCMVNYGKIKVKVECSRAIPLSLFSKNITHEILGLSKSYSCNITKIVDDLLVCPRHRDYNFKCRNGTTMDLLWTCETSNNNLYYNTLTEFGDSQFIKDECDISSVLETIKPVYTVHVCDYLRCKAKKFIYPIEDAFCGCCRNSDDGGGGTGSMNFIPAIFNYNFYSPKCTEIEVYDPVANECRATGCYPGKRVQGLRCEMIFQNYKYLNGMWYLLPISFTPTDSAQNIQKEIQHYVLRRYKFILKLCFISVTSLMNGTSSNYVALTKLVPERDIIEFENQLINITTGLLKAYFNSFSTSYHYELFKMDFKKIKSLRCAIKGQRVNLVTHFLTCRHIIFKPGDYNIMSKNQNVVLINYESELQYYEYQVDDKKNLRICLERFDHILSTLEKSYSIYTVAMIICTSVSVLCLFLTLITYCLFQKLRTLPGKNTMIMVSNLLLFNTFYLSLMVLNESISSNGVCQFIGVMTHFFMLCCFGSFTVCTVHMFRIFGRTKLVTTVLGQKGKRLFCIYMLSVYGSSCFILTTNILAFYISTGMTSVGYDRNGKCFISTLTSFVITVLLPLILTFLLNITLYIITTYRLKKKINLSAELTKTRDSNRKEMCIFIKLFITTGCLWILQLVNFFVNNIAMYVVVFALNALQGVFIFTAYVCNRRILNMYRGIFFRGRYSVFNQRDTKHTESTFASNKKESHNFSDVMEYKQGKNATFSRDVVTTTKESSTHI